MYRHYFVLVIPIDANCSLASLISLNFKHWQTIQYCSVKFKHPPHNIHNQTGPNPAYYLHFILCHFVSRPEIKSNQKHTIPD